MDTGLKDHNSSVDSNKDSEIEASDLANSKAKDLESSTQNLIETSSEEEEEDEELNTNSNLISSTNIDVALNDLEIRLNSDIKLRTSEHEQSMLGLFKSIIKCYLTMHNHTLAYEMCTKLHAYIQANFSISSSSECELIYEGYLILGKAFTDQKRFHEALEIFKNLLNLPLNDARKLDRFYLYYAEFYLKQFNLSACLNVLNKVNESPVNSIKRDAFILYGDCYLKSGEFDKSVTKYEEAFKLATYSELVQAKINRKLAKVNFKLSNYKESRQNYERALQIYESFMKLDAKIDTLFEMGFLYLREGDLEASLTTLNKASDLSSQTYSESDFKTGLAYRNLAFYYMKTNYFVKSEELFLKAEKIFEKNEVDKAKFYTDFGRFYLAKCDWTQSEKYFLKSLEVNNSLNSQKEHFFMVKSYENLGDLCALKQDYLNSIDFYLTAFQINKNLFNEKHIQSLKISIKLSVVFLKVDDFYNSLKYLMQANLYIKSGTRLDADALYQLAIIYAKLNRFKLAQEKFNTWSELSQIISRDALNVLLHKAKSEFLLHNLDEALKLYEKALEKVNEKFKSIDVKEKALVFKKIGDILMLKNDFKNALKNFKKSYAIYHQLYPETHKETAVILTYLGKCYIRNGEYSRAHDTLTRALNINKSLFENSPLLAESYTYLSRLNLVLGDYTQSLNQIKLAEAILERKNHLFKNINLILAQAQYFYHTRDFQTNLKLLDSALHLIDQTINDAMNKNVNLIGVRLLDFKFKIWMRICETLREYGMYELALEKSKQLDKFCNIFDYELFDNLVLIQKLNTIGKILLKTGKAKASLSLFLDAHKIGQAKLGNNLILIETLVNVSHAYLRLNLPKEALEFCKSAFEISEIMFSKNSVEFAQLLIELGDVYFCLGENNHGLEFYEKADAIIRSVPLEKVVTFEKLAILNKLGLCRTRLGVLKSTSENYFLKSLDCYRKLLINGEKNDEFVEHIDVAFTFDCLGQFQIRAGDAMRGIENCKKSLKMYHNIYNSDQSSKTDMNIERLNLVVNHPKVAECLSNIGLGYLRFDYTDKALIYLEKSLQVLDKLSLNKEEYFILERPLVRNSLGLARIRHGQLTSGINECKNALYELEQFDLENLRVSLKEINLADSLKKLEQSVIIKDTFKQIEQDLVKLNTEKKGLFNLEIAKCYYNIGFGYGELYEFEASFEYLFKSLVIYYVLLEHDHSDVASCLNLIGLIYMKQQKFQLSGYFLNKSFEIRTRLYEKNHPDLAMSTYNSSLLNYKQGRLEYSKVKCEEALRILNELFSYYKPITNRAVEAHPDFASAYYLLGLISARQKSQDEELEAKRRAFEIRKLLYGTNHFSLAQSLNSLGVALDKMKSDKQEVISYFLSSFRMLEFLNLELPIDLVFVYENYSKKLSESRKNKKQVKYLVRQGIDLKDKLSNKNECIRDVLKKVDLNEQKRLKR